MARVSHARPSPGGSSFFATAVGVMVLLGCGLALGFVIGVVARAPDLVAGHLAGRSREVRWDDSATTSMTADSRERVPEIPASRSSVVVEPRGVGNPAAGRALADVAAPPPARRWAVAKSAAPSSPKSAVRAAVSLRYVVQVGAFGDRDAARRLARRLSTRGFHSYVVDPVRDERWRVRVGPGASRSRAEKVAQRLKSEEYLPTWVLTENGS